MDVKRLMNRAEHLFVLLQTAQPDNEQWVRRLLSLFDELEDAAGYKVVDRWHT